MKTDEVAMRSRERYINVHYRYSQGKKRQRKTKKKTIERNEWTITFFSVS